MYIQGSIMCLTCQAICVSMTWPVEKELCGGCVAKLCGACKVCKNSTYDGAKSVLCCGPSRKRGDEVQYPPMHSADGGDSGGDASR